MQIILTEVMEHLGFPGGSVATDLLASAGNAGDAGDAGNAGNAGDLRPISG